MLQVLLMLFTANNYKGEKNTRILFGSFVQLSDDKKKEKKKKKTNNRTMKNSIIQLLNVNTKFCGKKIAI